MPYLLSPQIYDGDGLAAAVVGFVGDALDERVGGEEFGEAAAEGSGAVTVNDANAEFSGDGGLVEEFVDEAAGFLEALADYVDVVGGGGVGGLGIRR